MFILLEEVILLHVAPHHIDSSSQWGEQGTSGMIIDIDEVNRNINP